MFFPFLPCPSVLRHLWDESRASHAVVCRVQVTKMGLFGLGIPELAIIAGVSVLLFGKCFRESNVSLLLFSKLCSSFSRCAYALLVSDTSFAFRPEQAARAGQGVGQDCQKLSERSQGDLGPELPAFPCALPMPLWRWPCSPYCPIYIF